MGIVALVGFAVGGTLVVPNAAPLHDLPGLYTGWSSLPSYISLPHCSDAQIATGCERAAVMH